MYIQEKKGMISYCKMSDCNESPQQDQIHDRVHASWRKSADDIHHYCLAASSSTA